MLVALSKSVDIYTKKKLSISFFLKNTGETFDRKYPIGVVSNETFNCQKSQ